MRPCFIALNCTLRDLDMVEQQFSVHCFLNCMFRCPELDAPDGKDLLKVGSEGLESLPVQESHSSNDDIVRRFKSGFCMNSESTVLPINPNRLLNPRRIRSYELMDETYYYYPAAENVGQQCAGLVKMVVEFKASVCEAFYMHHYPFDRQLMVLNIKLRKGWYLQFESPDWNDTGYQVRCWARRLLDPQSNHEGTVVLTA